MAIVNDGLSAKEFVLKNSGEQQVFSTGSRRDLATKKGAYELISPIMLRRLAMVMQNGALRYGERNWEKGMPMGRTIQSAIRHIFSYLHGMRDEDHLAQAIFNCMVLIHTEEMIELGNLPKELSDLPNYTQKSSSESVVENLKSVLIENK